MIFLWKAAATVILTVILGAAIGKREKDIAIVLSAVVCCIIAKMSMDALSDVFAFVWEIGEFIERQSSFVGMLLKIAGVAIVSELTGQIGADAGNSALRKAMELFGNAWILYLSLPVFQSLFEIVQEILNIV